GLGGFLLYQALKDDTPAAPAPIPMPTLTNKTLDDAVAELKADGFRGTIKPTPVPSPDPAVGENIVYKQDPAPNTQLDPTTGLVTLTYNPPKAPFQLGNFVGYQVNDVITVLKQNNVPYKINQVESDKPVGEVIAQDPPPGQVGGDTVVTLTVSKGP